VAPPAQGWNIRFNRSIYRMKVAADASAQWAGNAVAATIGFESKGFTMRTKVVKDARIPTAPQYRSLPAFGPSPHTGLTNSSSRGVGMMPGMRDAAGTEIT
jgi:hypothetical protein